MNDELVTVSHCLFKSQVDWINEKAAEDDLLRSNSYILRKLIDKVMRQELERSNNSQTMVDTLTAN